MAPKRYILLLSLFLFTAACNKYSHVESQQISGYLFISDPLSNQAPVAAGRQTVYLNTGTGTASFVFKTTTDTTGFFSINYPGNQLTAYSHVTLNGTQYSGVVTFYYTGGTIHKDIVVTPNYFNGLGITLSDSLNGPVANLPVRLYTSRLMAVVDSQHFANIIDTSGNSGQIIRYNIPAAKYYIVSNDSIGGLKLKVFDSVTIRTSGLFSKKAIFK